MVLRKLRMINKMDLSKNRLAIGIGIDTQRINEIVLGKRVITADTVLRLSRFFGNSRNSGWDCNHNMILMWLKIDSENGWIMRSVPMVWMIK